MANAKLAHPKIEPRIEKARALNIVGLRNHHNFDDHMFVALARQWEEFGPMIPGVANPKGHAAFGLCFDMTADKKSFDYLTGVEVTTLDAVKKPFAGVTLPPKTYAVFPHEGHVSRLNETVGVAWDWLPKSGRLPDCDDATEPTFIEHYGEKFDPETGFGDIEVWFPVKA